MTSLTETCTTEIALASNKARLLHVAHYMCLSQCSQVDRAYSGQPLDELPFWSQGYKRPPGADVVVSVRYNGFEMNRRRVVAATFDLLFSEERFQVFEGAKPEAYDDPFFEGVLANLHDLKATPSAISARAYTMQSLGAGKGFVSGLAAA